MSKGDYNKNINLKLSKGNSEERARMMKALGAEVVLVDQAPNSEKGKVSGAGNVD